MVIPALLSVSLFGAPEPILHLRADTGLVLDSEGGIKRWRDLSPRGTDFSSLDSIRRPTSTEKGLQGRASVRFAGSQILADTVSALPLDAGFTLFFVAQDSNPSGNSAFLNKGRSDASVDLWGQSAGNFQFSQAWVVTVAKTSFETSAPMLYEATFDGDSARLFVAGRREAAGAFTGTWTRSKTTWLCGAKDGNWQGYFRGHVGEILVYPGELADTTRIRIESELLEAWSIERLGTWERPAVVVDTSTPDPILHLRADTGLVIDAKGALKTWLDLSPRGTDFHALDETGKEDSIRRPMPVGDGMNGLPAVSFSGSQLLCDTSSLPLDSGFSLFFVARDRNPSGHTAFLDKGEGDLSVNLWGSNVGNFQMSQSWVVVLSQSDFQSSAPVLYEATWDGDTSKLYANGKLLASAMGRPVDLVRARRTWLGGNHHESDGGLGHFLTGEISEVVVFPEVVSRSARLRIEAEMIDRWNLVDQTTSRGPRAGIPAAGTVVSRARDGLRLENPDGLRATLLDTRGRIVSRVEFRSGTARIPASIGIGILRIETLHGVEIRRATAPR